MSLRIREPLEVGDTVRLLSGGSLMMVEGFEPCERKGKLEEQGLVKCVVIYTDGRPDGEKERGVFPRFWMDKWKGKAREAA